MRAPSCRGGSTCRSRSTTTRTSARSPRSRSAPAAGSPTSIYVMVSSGIGAGLDPRRPAPSRRDRLRRRARPRATCADEGRRLPLRQPRLPRDRRLDRRAARRCCARRTAPDLTRGADASSSSPPATSARDRVVYDAGRAIGRVLAGLCNLLNPQAIIVGGELSAAGEPLLERHPRRDRPLRAAQRRRARVEVKPGVLGERAEVLGALALVIGDTERLRSAGSRRCPVGSRSPMTLSPATADCRGRTARHQDAVHVVLRTITTRRKRK